MLRKLILSFLFSFALILQSNAQVSITAFASGLSEPVDIKSCGDERLFIVEQRGYIQILDTNGVKRSSPFLNIQSRVKYGSEQGLLGLAFPKDFLESGYFYVYYTYQTRGDVRVSRFRVSSSNPDSADANSEEILLNIWEPYSNHNGGHLAFGPDGYLYIGTGDGGSGGDPGNRAQNRDTLLGKMLRLQVDPSYPGYKIPGDNAYVCSGQNGAPEIWAIGLRNPWRWSFDRATGDLWIGDVGQNAWEEIDFQPAGQGRGWNYGWRCYEGTASYDLSGGCGPLANYISPVTTLSHSGGRCSVTGGYVYRGARYNDMYGKYYFTDYCAPAMFSIEPDGMGGFISTSLGSLGGSSFSCYGEDSWGELYVASLSGSIYKFMSTDCIPAATLNGGRDTIRDCGNGSVVLRAPAGKGYSYSWSLNGNPLSGDSATYLAQQAGTYAVVVQSTSGCSNTDSIVYIQQSPLIISFQGLDTLYCVNDSPVNLIPSIPGGYFEGNGMSCSTFDPGAAWLGTHTITYTYKTTDGCVYTYSQTLRVDACSKTDGQLIKENMTLFPNPGSGIFTLAIPSQKTQSLKVEVYNLPGTLVYDERFELIPGENRLHLNLEKLSAGFYSIRMNGSFGSITEKILVQD